MDPHLEISQALTRRTFLGRSGVGIGGLALAALLNGNLFGAVARPHRAARAKGLRPLRNAALIAIGQAGSGRESPRP